MEELAAAGVTAHLAEPADTASRAAQAARQDRQDRLPAPAELLADGRLPECWIPPGHILECRALLELYHDLRAEHTAWVFSVGRSCGEVCSLAFAQLRG